ncbi:endonuclease domain-containing protein [Streptomyces tendae]|uniref:endonuclease domain-containing protein n=1 Tax=Streptomyces tendae TaxID=1932 RepID=UPI0033B5132D
MTHIPPAKSRCAHRKYGLSCADYDRLHEHAGGACQICGRHELDTRYGLVVDHDAKVGNWAVRGLLCNDCNSALPCGSAPGWALDYLQNPWWRRELAARGITNHEAVEEPPIGTRILADGRLGFKRTKKGWEHTAAYFALPRSWQDLNRRFGPHNIRVVG